MTPEPVIVNAYHCGECQCVKLTEKIPWLTRHDGVVKVYVAPVETKKMDVPGPDFRRAP